MVCITCGIGLARIGDVRGSPIECPGRRRKPFQQFPRVYGCSYSYIVLPLLVLVGIRVVANAANRQALEVIHHACCLHLKAQRRKSPSNVIPCFPVLHDRVSRSGNSVVDPRFVGETYRSWLQFIWVAAKTCWRPERVVFIGRLEKAIGVVRARDIRESASQEACHSTAGRVRPMLRS